MGEKRKAGTAGDKTSEQLEKVAKANLAGSYAYFLRIADVLTYDVKSCLPDCSKTIEQFNKSGDVRDMQAMASRLRSLVRAFSAYVEGVLFLMRTTVLYAKERGEIKLDFEVEYFLREETFRMKNGTPQTPVPRFNELKENFRISFKYFPQAFNSNYQIDYSDNGWAKLGRVIAYRNQITHPKSLKDMVAGKSTFTDTIGSLQWFDRCLRELKESIDIDHIKRLSKNSDSVIASIFSS